MNDPLLDQDFLVELDSQQEREVFAKIISMTFDEQPTEEITGKVTQGSVTVDGTSAVRRSCSLTLVAHETNIHEYYWGLNTKFKLMVGLRNNINSSYPDIIWFPQGIYLITSFNTTQSANSYQISIQGKDKMCLLNGDIGGVITANSVDFGQLTILDEYGYQTKQDLLLKDIIYEAVHEYAKEPYQNIIINDLDEAAVELLEYRGSQPMYFIVDTDTNDVTNMTMNGGQLYYSSRDLTDQIALEDIEHYDSRIELSVDKKLIEPTIVYSSYTETDGTVTAEPHTVIKAEYGDVVGYRVTDLVYAGDFIASVGTSITSGCLDKIKTMLGEYEYFYNLDGQFVFQKKPTYVNTSWNNIVTQESDYILVKLNKYTYKANKYYIRDENSSTRYIICKDENFVDGKNYYKRVYNENYVDNAASSSADTFSFENSNLIISIQNTPDFANLKNDFSIWGKRTSVTGVELPIHLRYAIDRKPVYYTNYNGVTYTTKTKEEVLKDGYKGGYQKEAAKFGLSEDWWEARDWANAWLYSGASVPTDNLGTYCSSKAMITSDQSLDGTSYNKNSVYYSYVSQEDIDSWDSALLTYASDDLVFSAEGKLVGGHGSCMHPYTWWLKQFETDGKYENGYVYFYNPQVPDSEVKLNLDSIQYEVDWRELIYQMALDYNNHSHDDDFVATIRENNPDYYPTGYTGYELYYTDMLGFWRQLYNPDYTGSYKVCYITQSVFSENPTEYYWYDQQSSEDSYSSKVTYYVLQLDGTYSTISITKEEYAAHPSTYYILRKGSSAEDYDRNRVYYQKETDEFIDNWSVTISDNPEALNFWFDFLDTEGDLSQYSAHSIGNRPKAENDDTIKSIYFRETPTVIFVDNSLTATEIQDQKYQKQGYTFIKLSDGITSLFTMSSQGKSAMDELDNLLYSNAYCAEAISLTTLPIYHLEPNTRIFVRDDNSGINGEYIITRLTIPLGHSGNMSISASKTVERIY